MFFKKAGSADTFVPEIITKDWLNDLLQEHCTLTTGSVASVVLKRRFLHHHSDILFLKVNYSPDADARLPEEWVLKVRTHFEGEAEIRFYQQAVQANRLNFLPRAGAFKAWPSGESVLLLESLKASHRLVVTDELVFNQRGWRPTSAMLRQLITTLAHFHSEWWNQPELKALYNNHQDYDEILARDVPAFKMKAGQDTLLEELVDRAVADIPGFIKRANEMPVTLIHGDCFPWHFFQGRSGEDVKLFDFEFSMIHSPAYDLVSLLSYWRGNYSRWFRQYHEALVSQQITGYSFEQLLEDINLAIAAHASRAVFDWHRGCSSALWQIKLTSLAKMSVALREI